LHITGALRSTLTDMIDACVDMIPFHLLVKKITHRAATRLATLPWSHPLESHVTWAANRYVKHHRAPIHEILHTFRIHPAKFESIKPCT